MKRRSLKFVLSLAGNKTANPFLLARLSYHTYYNTTTLINANIHIY